MFRQRRRVPLYTHEIEQDYSNRILRIKTQLELYNDLKQISEDLPNNPQIMQLKMITQKKIIEDIGILQKTGFDITSLIATFGVKLLKADIIEAESTINTKSALDSSDSGVIVDLVAEDKILKSRVASLLIDRSARASRISSIISKRSRSPRAKSASKIISSAPIIDPLGVPPVPISIPQVLPAVDDDDEEIKYSEEVKEVSDLSETANYAIIPDPIAEKYKLLTKLKRGATTQTISTKVSYDNVVKYIEEKVASNQPIDIGALSWILKSSGNTYNKLKSTGEYNDLVYSDKNSRLKAVHKLLNDVILKKNRLPESNFEDFVASPDPGQYFNHKIAASTMASSARV